MSDSGGQTARDLLAQAEAAALAAVDAAPDGHEGFRLAAELGEEWRAAAARVRDQGRGRAAARIRDDESLSLRSLAQVVGMGKSRADQLIREASDHE